MGRPAPKVMCSVMFKIKIIFENRWSFVVNRWANRMLFRLVIYLSVLELRGLLNQNLPKGISVFKLDIWIRLRASQKKMPTKHQEKKNKVLTEIDEFSI